MPWCEARGGGEKSKCVWSVGSGKQPSTIFMKLMGKGDREAWAMVSFRNKGEEEPGLPAIGCRGQSESSSGSGHWCRVREPSARNENGGGGEGLVMRRRALRSGTWHRGRGDGG